ncbi:MAG TPA: TIGR02270 family protein [Gemmataceae bacterium]|nr:TIGR02270 family protein [Gemmataceae bacterium]
MNFIRKVLDQHAEEGAFLWHLRQRAVGQPHYLLLELSKLDHRLDGHLDGLVVAGDAGWQFALEQLDAFPEHGETFTCAYIGLAGRNQARIARVLEAAAVPANARAVVSALGWLPHERDAQDYVLQFGMSDDPLARRIGVAAGAIRRLPGGLVLQKALLDKDPGVAARAARAVGELGATNLVGPLRPMLAAPDAETRFWAAWSLALLSNDTSALGELRTVALTEKTYRWRAVDLVCRRGDPRSTVKWLPTLEVTPGGTRLLIQGLRAVGDPEAIPRLLEWMKDPPLARVAGEAFAHITGTHISYDKLEADPPEGFESGPTEDPTDEDVALDPDGNLYWPDPAKCADWWAKNRKNFAAGTRYLDGKPIASDTLREVLRKGYQRQRAAAALELAMREPGKPLFEVRAPGFRQAP